MVKIVKAAVVSDLPGSTRDFTHYSFKAGNTLGVLDQEDRHCTYFRRVSAPGRGRVLREADERVHVGGEVLRLDDVLGVVAVVPVRDETDADVGDVSEQPPHQVLETCPDLREPEEPEVRTLHRTGSENFLLLERS